MVRLSICVNCVTSVFLPFHNRLKYMHKLMINWRFYFREIIRVYLSWLPLKSFQMVLFFQGKTGVGKCTSHVIYEWCLMLVYYSILSYVLPPKVYFIFYFIFFFFFLLLLLFIYYSYLLLLQIFFNISFILYNIQTSKILRTCYQ